MDNFLQDLRYCLRMLARSPGYTAVAILSLALGIGANTAIFSVVNAVILKSLPYAEPDRIVLVWGHDRSEGETRNQVSATDVHDFRTQNSVFEDITTYGDWSATLTRHGEPERLQGMQVGDGYFSIMRGNPLLGRAFLPEEQQEGKDFVIILTYSLWQRRFNGAADVIGQKITLSGRPYTIVGVMEPGFQSLPTSLIETPAQFYRPVAEPPDETARSSRHLRSIARLKSGIDLEQAQIEMTSIAQRLEQDHPDDNTGYGIRLVTLTDDTLGGTRDVLKLLFGAVAFVLLIACANVANLMLARSTARQKEIAVRAALGARRSRLIRQFVTESLVLSLLGGIVGSLVAPWAIGTIQSLGGEAIPLLQRVEVDLTVLGFTLAVSLFTGLLFGLAPALQMSKPDLNQSLKDSGRGSTEGGRGLQLRRLLVVSEIAMSLVLLVCAGLMIRTVWQLSNVNPGFNTKNLLTMNVWLPHAKYPNDRSWIDFYDRATKRIELIPGVAAAGLTSVLPLSKNFDGRGIDVEDNPRPPGERDSADLYIVTPGYLRAMETPLIGGRLLGDQDGTDAPRVALVNETMARRLWPGRDPMGRRFKVPGAIPIEKAPWFSVVGIVQDVKQYGLDKTVPMQMYLPEAQFPTSTLTLVVRTELDATNLTAAVRSEIASIDPEQAVFNITTMDELALNSFSLRRFSMTLFGIFAGLALVLAAIGIYGVISYSVTHRTHEFGIRMALGAKPSDVLTLVLGHGIRLAAAGVVLGLLIALAVTQLMSSLLFGVNENDPLTFALVAALLAAVALLSCYLPARRALRVDPMVALRYE
jgi:putative ABC transport system permease protein